MKKYVVTLTAEERAELEALTRKGQGQVRRLKRAQILLAADAGVSDQTIAQAVGVDVRTVERIRQRCVEEELEAALTERPRPGKARTLDGRQEAQLLALACSVPPAGRRQWTMQVLADQLVALQVVATISDETVRRTLKRGM